MSADGKSQVVKIYATEKIEQPHYKPVGSVTSDGKSVIDVAMPDGYLRLTDLQLAGKKRLTAKEFLNGFKNIESYTFE